MNTKKNFTLQTLVNITPKQPKSSEGFSWSLDEDLYVYFCELDTEDLLEVSNFDLSDYEVAILLEVLQDRRDEIDMMVEEMKDEASRKKITVKLPTEILSQVTAWEHSPQNLTYSELMLF
jgi:hypothetical protein